MTSAPAHLPAAEGGDTRRESPTAAAPAPSRRWPAWAPWVLVGVLVLARMVAVGALLTSGVEDEHSVLGGDARRYEVILSSEGTPYRDFAVEYPPVALGLMKLVDRPTPLATITLLAFSQLALELATAGVLAWAWSRRVAVTYLVLGTPMVLFPFPYVRIDLLSVFLAVLGLALLRRGREAVGGAALAVSVFTKVWPVVTAPVMLLRRQWTGLAAWAITGVAGLAAWVAWAGPDGIGQILTFRGADGWQIESLPGIVLHALDPDGSTVQEGAWRTAVSAPGAVRNLLSLLGLGVVVLAWWLAWRATTSPAGPDDERPRPPTELTGDDLVVEALAPLAAVLAMLIFSTIVSPQYVLWFLPFAALAAAQGDRTIGALSLAIAFLSMLGLAWIHGLIPGEWHVVAVIALRNLLLLVLLVVTLGRLWSRAWRSRRPRFAPVGDADAPDAPPW
jgi:hypothetical protein